MTAADVKQVLSFRPAGREEGVSATHTHLHSETSQKCATSKIGRQNPTTNPNYAVAQ